MSEKYTTMEYPKVLVISNNSFSKTSNNGRTLGNLFIGWPKDRIAQFCVSTTTPDYEVCDNYYLMTDRSALGGFIHFRKGKRCRIEDNLGTEGNTSINGKKQSKTPLKRLLRHFVWSGKSWNSKEFQKWINDFNPEVVLVMNSDATFILDIATEVTSKRNIPLVMFNTEGFYFIDAIKHRNYGPLKIALQKCNNYIYRKHFRRMMKKVKLSIHLNSLLARDFRSEFGGEHIVLYTGSGVQFDSSNLHIEKPSFAYMGNFGFDRPQALVEIAEVLQSINPSYMLDVYGKAPTEKVVQMFSECPGISYHGMIPYEDVINVLHSTTILIHAEVQSEKYEESLRYGFSTKIADSISSGHPFLMFSSPEVAGAKYIIDTGAAWFAQNKTELKEAILSILSDEVERSRVLGVAHSVAEKNHSIEKNRETFVNAINSVFEQNQLK